MFEPRLQIDSHPLTRMCRRSLGWWTFAFLGLAASAAVQAQDDPSRTAGEASFMFVQTARRGVVKPIGDPAAGRYSLELHGVRPETVYFSDRPERIAGSAPMDRFLSGFSFGAQDPPNAALTFDSPAGQQGVAVVELTAPRYDAGSQVLTYEIRMLGNYGGQNLAHWASKAGSKGLPAGLQDVSLFIDDCPNETVMCFGDYQCSGGGEGEECCRVSCGSPSAQEVGYCWQWLSFSCEPCQDYSGLCNGTVCGVGNPLCLEGQCTTDAQCM
ncbi:MAG TPA: hypothetical protein VLQ45_16890 [Thermoanaerobaculia bacterium]|nr:hypothetical protein [Thermoanaerobaculia bacterium]